MFLLFLKLCIILELIYLYLSQDNYYVFFKLGTKLVLLFACVFVLNKLSN